MESSSSPGRRTSPWAVIAVIAAIVVLVAILSTVTSCTSVVRTAAESVGVIEKTPAHNDIPHVSVIYMAGSIDYDGSECSPSGLKSLLDSAAADNAVKAVVLFVNSGGGTAAAGEEMSALVRDFEKPVVVSSGATNASAAYEISSQADYIFAAKSSALGSIGVAMQVTDLSGLYDMLGISVEDIVSSESKDSTYGNRPLTDQEREWYQSMVDQLDSFFIQTVAEGRHMEIDAVSELANGLTYTGADAVENGLADGIGYMDDAVLKASQLAGFERSLPAQRLQLPTGSPLSSMLDILGASMGSAMADAVSAQDDTNKAIGTIR